MRKILWEIEVVSGVGSPTPRRQMVAIDSLDAEEALAAFKRSGFEHKGPFLKISIETKGAVYVDGVILSEGPKGKMEEQDGGKRGNSGEG